MKWHRHFASNARAAHLTQITLKWLMSIHFLWISNKGASGRTSEANQVICLLHRWMEAFEWYYMRLLNVALHTAHWSTAHSSSSSSLYASNEHNGQRAQLIIIYWWDFDETIFFSRQHSQNKWQQNVSSIGFRGIPWQIGQEKQSPNSELISNCSSNPCS